MIATNSDNNNNSNNNNNDDDDDNSEVLDSKIKIAVHFSMGF